MNGPSNLYTVLTALFGLIFIAVIVIAAIIFLARRKKAPAQAAGNVTGTIPRPGAQNIRRCPKCQSTYTDQTLNFCLTDGAPLESSGDEYETVIRSK